MSVYTYMYVCVYVSMYVCVYVSMYVCIYVSMYVCVYVYICLCMCVYMYVYVCMCVYVYVNEWFYNILRAIFYSRIPRILRMSNLKNITHGSIYGHGFNVTFTAKFLSLRSCTLVVCSSKHDLIHSLSNHFVPTLLAYNC